VTAKKTPEHVHINFSLAFYDVYSCSFLVRKQVSALIYNEGETAGQRFEANREQNTLYTP